MATKCACGGNCVCTVSPGEGVERDGKLYCSEICARGEAGHQCGHHGCSC